jgi:hypothetical protein
MHGTDGAGDSRGAECPGGLIDLRITAELSFGTTATSRQQAFTRNATGFNCVQNRRTYWHGCGSAHVYVGQGRIKPPLSSGMPLDLAGVRLDNALALFEEFVQANVKHPDAATLRGLEGRFAERLGIQPSYWSQIKSRSRQIGERLARQFEQQCKKPNGWMDIPASQRAIAQPVATGSASSPTPGANTSLPQDEDERFIVGLVLTYYRRHPSRARARLLDILGEVLTPDAPGAAPGAVAPSSAPKGPVPPPAGPAADQELWARMRAGVAPLKRKR